ncbi:hypothetical protein [Pararhizobium sp. PWRC1-1]|uniref:hypothetical protein n=1 Tax=Pararhizobium sp. PWRC1-1 TaxID=2804566 RepID=UPI003CF18F60
MKEGAVTLGISLAILIRMSLSFVLSFIHNRQFIVNGYYGVRLKGATQAPHQKQNQGRNTMNPQSKIEDSIKPVG